MIALAIPFVLKWLLGKSGITQWLIVGGVVLVLAGIGGITYTVMHYKLKDAASELALEQRLYKDMKAANDENVATIEKMANAKVREDKIVADTKAQKAALAVKADAINKEIDDAPETDDGPIAPDLQRALDWVPSN